MRLVDHLSAIVSHADLEFLPLQNPAKVAGSPPRIMLRGSLIGQRHPLGVEDLHRIDNMEVVAGHACLSGSNKTSDHSVPAATQPSKKEARRSGLKGLRDMALGAQ